MAFKFFNIAKANAEIERLTAANAALQTQVDELAKNEPEAIASLTAENSKLTEQNGRLAADLAGLKDSLKAAQDENAKLIAEAASAQKLASAKALEITASQGQPPIKTETVTGNSTLEIEQQLAAETDPRKRRALFVQHQARINSKVDADRIAKAAATELK
jgi:cell division protein FtsB